MDENASLTTLISNSTADYAALSDVDFSSTFQFWFFFPFHILSIPCYLSILTYIILKRAERQALHNHPIIIFLTISICLVIFDYSWTLDSARHEGQVWLSSDIFCEIWWFIDLGFYGASTVILAWTSFERHILIFHSDLVRSKQKQILIHYLPMIMILLYLFIFYIVFIFLLPCENKYDFTLPLCGAYPCFISIPYMVGWELIAHGIIPTFLIAFFNVTLLFRVVWQKRRHRQDWKKCRRMTVQILSISSLFLSIKLPLMVISLAHNIGYANWATQTQTYLFLFCSLIQYLSPFICLISLSNVWKKLKLLFRRNGTQVMPARTV